MTLKIEIKISVVESKEKKVLAITTSATQLPANPKSKFKEDTRNKMYTFIQAYARLYKEKYGSAPEGLRDKTIIGKLGHWIEGVPADHAVSLVEVYLKIDHKWINEQQHDLWQFFRNLNRIGNALAAGGGNSINWNEVFK